MGDGISGPVDMLAASLSRPAPPADAALHAHALGYEASLVADVERLRRYAATAKDVSVAPELLDDTTKALQTGKALLTSPGKLDLPTESLLIAAVNALTPKIYPATLASLEIADIMEVGNSGLNVRERQICHRVKRLVAWWIWITAVTLFLVILTSAASEKGFFPDRVFINDCIKFFSPIILGLLGSCSFILRGILQGLANKTFVLRDSSAYALRSILGMILGYIIPHLYGDSAGLLTSIAVPFLAGYAVEPMFAALDNVVLTLRDAVSRTAAPGDSKAK
ncbi:MAG: hypothetical protein QOJ54_3495 [Aliidongia sp.]|nr:hypothetical protein [Aliidongia sp.]